MSALAPSSFIESAWLVPCYALMGSTLSALWFPGITRRTGPRPAGYVNSLFTAIALIHSLVVLFGIWGQPAQTFSSLWLDAANLQITIDWTVSSITAAALVVITTLNLLAQIYAVGYLEMDWGWARFYAVVGLFEAGLCALSLSNSLFFAYFILEILTLCTYLLIGLWFNQSLVVTGARDAFLTKRVGDLILLMGVVALLPLAGTWNFDELATWAATAKVDPNIVGLVSLALVAGPLGKCAQFPLHLWLDEAMEGPLPATILRNAVVVSTGAWVLIKLEPIFAIAPIANTVMIGIGAATALGASLIAIAQIDVKRALSYPVSAYMGLEFIAVGTGQTDAAYLLLLTYAIAMAILVMSVGVIVSNNVTQNLTQIGGLWSRRPIAGLSFIVGCISLVALPPFGSFWSLVNLADGVWLQRPWLLLVLLMVNGLTAFGLMRVFSLIWGGKPKQMSVRSPEVLWPMVMPMTLLAGLALHLPIILQSLHLLPSWGRLDTNVALLMTWSSLTGIALGAVVYLSPWIAKPVKLPIPLVQDLFAYDLYTPQIYKVTVVGLVGLVSNIVSLVDRYLVDGFVNLVGLLTMAGGQGLKYNTSGQTQFYTLTILLSIALLGLLTLWPLLAPLLPEGVSFVLGDRVVS